MTEAVAEQGRTRENSSASRRVKSNRGARVGLLAMALAIAISVSWVAASPKTAEAGSYSWGWAGVSYTLTRAETAAVASKGDNAAYTYVALGLSAAAGWQGALIGGGFFVINDNARSAVAQGKCLSFYRPYYLPTTFWPRIVTCRA